MWNYLGSHHIWKSQPPSSPYVTPPSSPYVTGHILGCSRPVCQWHLTSVACPDRAAIRLLPLVFRIPCSQDLGPPGLIASPLDGADQSTTVTPHWPHWSPPSTGRWWWLPAATPSHSCAIDARYATCCRMMVTKISNLFSNPGGPTFLGCIMHGSAICLGFWTGLPLFGRCEKKDTDTANQ